MIIRHHQLKTLCYSFTTVAMITMSSPSFADDASSPRSTEARETLETKLINLGVDQEEAETRVKHLTDAQVEEALVTMEKSPAGKDDTITIGVGTAILIALLLIIFL